MQQQQDLLKSFLKYVGISWLMRGAHQPGGFYAPSPICEANVGRRYTGIPRLQPEWNSSVHEGSERTSMKVLLVNGSPHEKGSTYTALAEVANTLNKQEIKVEIFQLGVKPISGCIGCGTCAKIGKCFMRDQVNEFLEKASDADGFLFGSPVHFASASGMLTCFMDRVFYVNFANRVLDNKPAAAVVVCRRGGATAALDQINKYFAISNMPMVGSQYWNMVHGNSPEEIRKDLEGMQGLRTLGNNMAWLLKSIKAGKASGINTPEKEPRMMTNFIR